MNPKDKRYKKYVGKTENDPNKRWREHLAAARNNPLMVISKAIRKHGVQNFKFEILEECLSEEVNKKETYWIDKKGPKSKMKNQF